MDKPMIISEIFIKNNYCGLEIFIKPATPGKKWPKIELTLIKMQIINKNCHIKARDSDLI